LTQFIGDEKIAVQTLRSLDVEATSKRYGTDVKLVMEMATLRDIAHVREQQRISLAKSAKDVRSAWSSTKISDIRNAEGLLTQPRSSVFSMPEPVDDAELLLNWTPVVSVEEQEPLGLVSANSDNSLRADTADDDGDLQRAPFATATVSSKPETPELCSPDGPRLSTPELTHLEDYRASSGARSISSRLSTPASASRALTPKVELEVRIPVAPTPDESFRDTCVSVTPPVPVKPSSASRPGTSSPQGSTKSPLARRLAPKK
jgi:hypothetical protein